MDKMRWILLLAGIVIVLGIYVFSRLQTWRGSKSPRAARQIPETDTGFDPLFDSPRDDAAVEADLASLGQMIADNAGAQDGDEPQPAAAQPRRPVQPEKVVTLFVLAPAGVPFRGTFLMEAMATAGLQFGDMQIFHYLEKYNGGERALFSLANLLEPGTFDPAAMENFTTRGLVLFLQLPAAFDAVKAFDAMVEAARSLAKSLEGTVCDATRSVLTRQTISHMREDVIDYQLRHRVAKTAS